MSSVNGGMKRRLGRRGRRRWRIRDSVWGFKAKVGPQRVPSQFLRIKSNQIRSLTSQGFGQVSFTYLLILDFVWDRESSRQCEVPTPNSMGGREGDVHETGCLQGRLLMSMINKTLLLQMHPTSLLCLRTIHTSFLMIDRWQFEVPLALIIICMIWIHQLDLLVTWFA